MKKKPLLKKYIKNIKKKSTGRNNSGKITIKHRGGGHNKKYRKINFLRNKYEVGITCSIEYDPYRNTQIASIFDFLSANFFYIIAPKNLKIGDIVKSGKNAEIKNGHCLPLSEIPVGSYIHNIALHVNRRAKISRSAGAFSRVTEKTNKYAKIKISSGENKFLSLGCFATIGIVSNELICLTRLGKAGKSRWMNKRPKVRGVAMNPIDHPHGGGEGKKSGKGLNYWGKPVKGKKSRRIKN